MENMNEKNVNIQGLSTETIPLENVTQAKPKKRKMSKGKLIALISSLSAAAAAVIIIPPVCVTQCNSAWNEHFEKPALEEMQKKSDLFATPVTYKLDLIESVPLNDEIIVDIETTSKTDWTTITVLEDSVTYDKKSVTFQVMIDVKRLTSSKYEEEQEIKTYWANFDVLVKQVKIKNPDDVVWQTRMSGFRLSVDVDVPVNKDVTAKNVPIDFTAIGENETDILIEGFETKTNASCLQVELSTEMDTKCTYTTIVEPTGIHTFNVRIKISGLIPSTSENINFLLLFTDKTDTSWKFYLDKLFHISVVFDYYVKLASTSKTTINVVLDKVTPQKISLGPFDTNLNTDNFNLDLSIKTSEISHPEFLDDLKITKHGAKEFSLSVSVLGAVENPDPIEYDVVLTITDIAIPEKPFTFNFKLVVQYDFFMGRSAYITDGNETYWFSSLENIAGSSFISDPTGEHKIVADLRAGEMEPRKWERSDFNYELNFNPELEELGDGFLKNCKTFNKPLNLPSSIVRIDSDFLYGCESFNQTLVIPNVAIIRENFLYGCSAFNNGSDGSNDIPLVLPYTVKQICDNFLNGTVTDTGIKTSFNQEIQFTLEAEGVTTEILDNFLKNQTKLNKKVTLPDSIQNIGNGFMEGCSVFNLPFKLPQSLEWKSSTKPGIGDRFMFNCDKMTSIINTGKLSSLIFEESLSKGILSSEKENSDLVTIGVQFEGNDKWNVCKLIKNLTAEQYEGKTIWRKTSATPSDVVYQLPDSEKVYWADAEKNSSLSFVYPGFKTNIVPSQLNVSITDFSCPTGEFTSNDVRAYIAPNKDDETLFDIRINVSNITEAKTINKPVFNYSLLFKEGSTEVKKISGFETRVTFDFWQSCQAVIIDAKGEPHYAATLIGANICSDNPTLPITTSDQKIWKRETFNLRIWMSPKLTHLPNNFLANCPSFNNGSINGESNPLYISESLKVIGENFLKNCSSFNQDIYFPNTLQQKQVNTHGFLQNCDSMQSTLNLSSLKADVFNDNDVNHYSAFTTTNQNAPMYLNGIKIVGYNDIEIEKLKVEFKNDVYDVSGTKYYRNLVG